MLNGLRSRFQPVCMLLVPLTANRCLLGGINRDPGRAGKRNGRFEIRR